MVSSFMRQLNNMDIALVRGALDTLGTTLVAKGHTWTEGERTIYEQAVETLQPDPTITCEAVCDELIARRQVGAMLATCAFNLKQKDCLTESDRNVLAELQSRWDAIKNC